MKILTRSINQLFAIAYACILASSVIADEGYIEIGAASVSDDSSHFGRFTGLNEEGGYGLLDFGYRSNANQQGGVFTAIGKDLGLDRRSAYFAYKQQGAFGLRFDFDSTPINRSMDVGTPYLGAGNENLSLPSDWVGGEKIADLTALKVNDIFDIDTRRDKSKLAGQWHLDRRWILKAHVAQEDKTGIELIGANFGDGGAPKAAQLPSPVDRTTNTIHLGLDHIAKNYTLNFSYTYSNFENNEDSLTFENPYNGFSTSADFDNSGIGRVALEPDNHAHIFLISGRYKIGKTSNISFHTKQSFMDQDEKLLPYAANPGLDTVSPVLPKYSADAEVDETYLSTNFTSRLFKNTGLKAKYTYRKRDNKTDRDDWYVSKNDTYPQDAVPSHKGAVRVNQPFSRHSHQFDVEAGYRISRSLKAYLGVEYEEITRDDGALAVDDTDTTTYIAKLRYRKPSFTGRLKFQHDRRRSDDYCDNCAYFNSNSSVFGPAQPGANPNESGDTAYVNDPLLRRRMLANLDEYRFTAQANYRASSTTVIGAKAVVYDKDYVATDFTGLKERNGFTINADLNYQINNDLDFFTYAGYEESEGDQMVYQWNYFSGLDQSDPNRSSDGDGGYEISRVILNIGLGMNWQPENSALKLSASYNYFDASTDYDSFDNSRPDGQVPDQKSKSHRFSLNADYQLNDQLQLKGIYVYETIETDDFAMDNLAIDSGRNQSGGTQVIYAPEEIYDYDVNYFGVAIRYSF